MCRQSEFQLSYFKLWRNCFDDDDEEEEIGSANLHTHLAFHFHGVAISAPERLRLVKTPIHFPGCSFCTTTPQKKVQHAFAHKKWGSRSWWAAPTKSDRFVSGRFGLLASVTLFHAPGWFGYFPDVCPSDRSELSARMGGDQLTAFTREWSFQMTSALPKNGILWDVHGLHGISYDESPRGKDCLFTS